MKQYLLVIIWLWFCSCNDTGNIKNNQPNTDFIKDSLGKYYNAQHEKYRNILV